MEQTTRMSVADEPALPDPGSPPEHWVHYGRVDVTIWKRPSEERDRYSISLGRSYRDKDDQWQRTGRLDEEDLLPAAKALEEAYAWVQDQRQKARGETTREVRLSSGSQAR
jgi:hypothetical protein